MPALSKPCAVGLAAGILVGVLTGFTVISDAFMRPMTTSVAPGVARHSAPGSPSRSQNPLPHQQPPLSEPAADDETAKRALSQTADGCAQVYLDVGSNIGVQVRKLYEPHYYRHAPVLEIFDDVFGPPEHRIRPATESGLCAFGFEASPVHVPRLTKLQSVYKNKGWRVNFIVPRAVSTTNDETITLNMNAKHNLGASVVWENTGDRGRGTRATIKTLDLPSWIESVVRHRVWNKASFPKAKPYVLMKMDIEGSEYRVLPEMLKRGLLCRGIIDMIFIEWHPQYVEDGRNQTRKLKRAVDDRNRCGPKGSATISTIDDETFNLDGLPLPGEVKWMTREQILARQAEKEANILALQAEKEAGV